MGLVRNGASCCACTVVLAVVAGIASSNDTNSASPEALASRPGTPKAAYARLVEGNRRFFSREPAVASTAEIDEMFRRNVAGQTPYATILTCADSRLSPSMLFDEFLGELFVVREAGNIAVSPTSLGSLEYGRVALDTPLLVVMGHEGCGAVHAALENADVPGNVKAVIEAIQPGIAGASDLEDAVTKNVRAVIESIRANSPILSDATMVGAVYRLGTGKVHFLDPAPSD